MIHHFQGNRYPVLSNLAGLIRNNEFKIRSVRVINELNTWIFKGDTGRIDHMEGSHDDTLCSLAMGLFVMQYSLKRIQSTVKKDKAILSSYMVGGSINVAKSHIKLMVSTGVHSRFAVASDSNHGGRILPPQSLYLNFINKIKILDCD